MWSPALFIKASAPRLWTALGRTREAINARLANIVIGMMLYTPFFRVRICVDDKGDMRIERVFSDFFYPCSQA